MCEEEILTISSIQIAQSLVYNTMKLDQILGRRYGMSKRGKEVWDE